MREIGDRIKCIDNGYCYRVGTVAYIKRLPTEIDSDYLVTVDFGKYKIDTVIPEANFISYPLSKLEKALK